MGKLPPKNNAKHNMKRPSKTENGPRKQRSVLNSQKFASNLQQP